MIDKEIEQRIKDSVDIVALANVYLTIKKAGANYRCVCPNPLHEDKSPSCYISPSKNIAHCFSCGWHSDGIGLVQLMEKCSYAEALRKIADINHIPIIEGQGFSVPEYNPNLTRKKNRKQEPTHIDASHLNGSLGNSFVKWLCAIADKKAVKETCELYRIGSKNDDVVFWYINQNDEIVDGKVMRYKEDGHRNKEKPPYFLHGYVCKEGERDILPFFGEHLLSMQELKDKPVGIVESEKTAIICNIFEPFYVWLATGGKTNGTTNMREKMRPLRGRKVFVFPDADAVQMWGEIVSSLRFAYEIELTTEWMEQATEKDGEKYDIADIMVRYYKD